MRGEFKRFFIVTVSCLVAGFTWAQPVGDITPFIPPACSQGVDWWASQQPLWEGDDPLLLAGTEYSQGQVKDFLNLGKTVGRDTLPLPIRLSQEFVAFKLNSRAGFPSNVETDLVVSEFEALLTELVHGLPTVDTTAFDAPGTQDQFDYYFAVLSGYNACMEPPI